MPSSDDKDKSDREKLDALILLFLLSLMAPADRFLSGDVLPERLPGLWMPILADFHARAGVLGRTAADVPGPEDAHDEAFGAAQAQSDKPFLENYTAQIEVKQKSGQTVTAAAMQNRLRLYAERLHASAHKAFVLASPAGSEYTWRLGAGLYRALFRL